MKIKMSTRLVVLTKTKAFKIPLDRQRMVARNQRRQGLEGPTKAAVILLRLLWSFGGFVCMRRITAPTRRNTCRSLLHMVKATIPALDITNCDLYRLRKIGATYRGNACVYFWITASTNAFLQCTHETTTGNMKIVSTWSS